MPNNNEKTLLYELPEVPPVPPGLYPAIERRIRRHSSVVHMSWAFAAALVLALGVASYTVRTSPRMPAATVATSLESNEVNDELQVVYDFLNGNTIEDEVNQYALVDPSFFQ